MCPFEETFQRSPWAGARCQEPKSEGCGKEVVPRSADNARENLAMSRLWIWQEKGELRLNFPVFDMFVLYVGGCLGFCIVLFC